MLDTTLQHNLFKEKVSYLNKNHSVIQALIVYMSVMNIKKRWEKFEDAKRIIRPHKSEKDRQDNG
jgi:hypothetical protein